MLTGTKRPLLVFSIVTASVQPVLAGGGGDIGGQEMTYQYCTEQVVKTGIIDVTKFNAEVQKCIANPVTYPPPPSRDVDAPADTTRVKKAQTEIALTGAGCGIMWG